MDQFLVQLNIKTHKTPIGYIYQQSIQLDIAQEPQFQKATPGPLVCGSLPSSLHNIPIAIFGPLDDGSDPKAYINTGWVWEPP